MLQSGRRPFSLNAATVPRFAGLQSALLEYFFVTAVASAMKPERAAQWRPGGGADFVQHNETPEALAFCTAKFEWCHVCKIIGKFPLNKNISTKSTLRK
jgi:hypothetical protein